MKQSSRMSKIVFFIYLLLLISFAASRKITRPELFSRCMKPLNDRTFDLWRLPHNWYQYSAYPEIHRGSVCFKSDQYVNRIMKNLMYPPLNYLPQLPLPLLLCTDYNHYAVIIFCKPKLIKHKYSAQYEQALVLTSTKYPEPHAVDSAKKCLKDFDFKHVNEMRKMKYRQC